MRSLATVVSASLVVFAGVALIVIREVAGDPDEPTGVISSVALSSPFLAAGLISLIGESRSKPAYSVAAGVALLPMSLISLILVPLLLPALVLIVLNAPRVLALTIYEAVSGVLIAAGLLAALALLFVHQDPATWSTPDGSAGASDIITTFEAQRTLGIVALVLAATVFVGRRSSRPAR
jgi:hypothetical protein